ncbi:MAG TPA: hypothetical protein PK369_09075 [Thermoclostridium sp.]|nr:hypothetical protein [Thermoclostridium sp.]
MVVSNSIRQLMRTPVKTFFFFGLLALAVAFFLLGYNLWFIAVNNIGLIEKNFITIGTVEQKPIAMGFGPETYEYSTWYGDISSIESYIEYGETYPASVLDFEGAGYIIKPERRPVYIASHPDYVVDIKDEDEKRFDLFFQVIEFEPLEDGITTNPIPVKVKRVLSGTIVGDDEIVLSHVEYDTPWQLHKGKTYIACLLPGPLIEDNNEFTYMPYIITRSSQYTKDGERIPEDLPVSEPWDEVTDDFYETPRGKRWLAVIEGIERMRHAIPVVPVDSTKLLVAFHSGNARIVEGRDISAEEYESGEKVCLIDKTFAVYNRLNVGGELRLPLYYADYYNSSSRLFSNTIPYIYDQLVNARGEGYSAFEDSVYRIVGIFDSPRTSRLSDYQMGFNSVVIPKKSVKNSDENNIISTGRMKGFNTSFQIPNGHIPEFLSKWEALGITDLKIVFYDNGYSRVKDGLEAMKKTAVILFAVGIAATLLVVTLFCHLFISKQKKRTAIERSLGMNKRLCALSLLAGLMLVVIAAYIFGSLAGYLLTDIIARQRPLDSNESFDISYSNWRPTADTYVKMSVSMEGIWRGALISASVIPATLLYALVSITMNLRHEPLQLLGEKNG